MISFLLDIVGSAAAILIPNIGAYVINNKFEKPSLWLTLLDQPPWILPDRYFFPIWTTVLSGVGLASYVVWRNGGGLLGDAKIALILYSLQLMIKWSWTPLFYMLESTKAGLINLCFLLPVVGLTIYKFSQISYFSGILAAPYFFWLVYIFTLNWGLHIYNPNDEVMKRIEDYKNVIPKKKRRERIVERKPLTTSSEESLPTIVSMDSIKDVEEENEKQVQQ